MLPIQHDQVGQIFGLQGHIAEHAVNYRRRKEINLLIFFLILPAIVLQILQYSFHGQICQKDQKYV